MAELSGNEQVQQPQPSYDILVIEDDEATGEMLTTCIESESAFRVWTLQSGEETLLHLQEHRGTIPFLIIIDYLLPGMNGMQLLDHLQSYKSFKQVPKILMTAATITHDMRVDLQDRNIAVLSKPLDLTELMDYLEYIRNTSSRQLL